VVICCAANDDFHFVVKKKENLMHDASLSECSKLLSAKYAHFLDTLNSGTFKF